MRHRITALIGVVVAGTVLSSLAWTAPAAADVPGFSVRVTAPGTITAGQPAATVTAVATSENRQCRKVRWVLLVRSGSDAGQLRVIRVEDDGPFAVDTSTEGNTTTIVDRALDPGTLCRGRTVTGRWQVAAEDSTGGQVQFEARAFDAEETLLTAAGATTTVRGDRTASPSASPSGKATPEKTTPAGNAGRRTGAVIADSSDETETALVANETTLLGPGLIVGGICVFLGVLLLIRLRSRARLAQIEEQAMPTGFYRMPGSSR
ncbi:hypothetical protein QLQ12_21190 [Actinoplanes sp. NEAU-A12]|uniref:Uncharacterized protein n=1 Tax=Actinoplanes sandaracinus TaxID=3045177 RepID=A0ABT6WN32_9ACTN|nr:hypothetical protein [Actinoplanes sandaracinus]MDI6101133.1 hypothetical protein [Actinoplanes sandaracinus]